MKILHLIDDLKSGFEKMYGHSPTKLNIGKYLVCQLEDERAKKR